MRTRNKTAKIITVSAVVFAVLLLLAMIINFVKLGRVAAAERQLKAQLEALDKQIAQNAGEIEYKSTDEYIEKYARDYLNMIGKDEKAFKGK